MSGPQDRGTALREHEARTLQRFTLHDAFELSVQRADADAGHLPGELSDQNPARHDFAGQSQGGLYA